MTDRGRDTSHELTEVRTVHTRATGALQQTIALLDPWARTGRTRKDSR